jgi:cyclopropane fatty-acyl-phospholipid synthase-like methyltransferase
MEYIERLRTQPIAIETAAANAQHYEVGTGVLVGMLGPRMKYSSCLYPKGGETLGQAEVEMLRTYGKLFLPLTSCDGISRGWG